MKRCFICGGKARIFTGERWICKSCYFKLREEGHKKEAKIAVESIGKTGKEVDLHLSEI